MKNLLVVIICCFGATLFGQHRVGVRAGLNYSKFNGPLEVNESYNITGGFHFGINYTYEFNSKFGLRGELLYIQRGTTQKYFGDTDFIVNPINPSNAASFLEEGTLDYNLKISTAFLSFPFTAQYRLTKKFELFGGLSLDLVVGPSGRGSAVYTSASRPDEIQFRQSLDHRYGSDEAGQYTILFSGSDLLLNIDDEVVTIPKIVGGYYNYTNDQREQGNRLSGFDMHLIGGVNYFINRAFYIGVRGEFGLFDVTNDLVDKSFNDFTDEGGLTFRSDKDTSFNLAVSFGFRF